MRSATILSVALCCAFVLALVVPAVAGAGNPLVPNGGFEDGTAGWVVSSGALTADGTGPVYEGGAAARVSGASVLFQNQFWNTPVTPGGTYRASAAIYDDDPAVTQVALHLTFVDDAGDPLSAAFDASAGADQAAWQVLTTADAVAPAGATGAVISISASANGGAFSVDAVALALVVDAPPPTPTPTPTATASPTPTPSPTATPSPIEAAAAPPPVSRAPGPGVATVREALANIDFENGVAGWEVSRGRAEAVTLLAGLGQSLMLWADDETTVWVQQTVTVEPSQWYAASAILVPGENVEAGWVRVAWYASSDGSGGQMSTDDSAAVATPSATAYTAAYDPVSSGPLQAPGTAHSAKVRVLLRPAGEAGAWLAIDDVRFDVTSPDEPPSAAAATATPVPAPAPTPAPALLATPRPATPQPAAPATAPASTPANVKPTAEAREQVTPTDPGRLALLAAQGGLRITELLPDPEIAGRDADYEWVELTNIGPTDATLDGVTLRDNRGVLTLPPVTLPHGQSIVILGRLAQVGDLFTIRVESGIGNGLGNAGDRLALISATGALIDAFSYGDDATYVDRGPQIGAPPPGRSIERRFDAAGRLVDVAVLLDPTPGRPPGWPGGDVEESAAVEPAPETPPSEAAARSGNGTSVATWLILAAAAGGLLGGAAMQRAVAVLRGRRGPDARPS